MIKLARASHPFDMLRAVLKILVLGTQLPLQLWLERDMLHQIVNSSDYTQLNNNHDGNHPVTL